MVGNVAHQEASEETADIGQASDSTLQSSQIRLVFSIKVHSESWLGQ
jgi:hypothetical protein